MSIFANIIGNLNINTHDTYLESSRRFVKHALTVPAASCYEPITGIIAKSRTNAFIEAMTVTGYLWFVYMQTWTSTGFVLIATGCIFETIMSLPMEMVTWVFFCPAWIGCMTIMVCALVLVDAWQQLGQQGFETNVHELFSCAYRRARDIFETFMALPMAMATWDIIDQNWQGFLAILDYGMDAMSLFLLVLGSILAGKALMKVLRSVSLGLIAAREVLVRQSGQ